MSESSNQRSPTRRVLADGRCSRGYVPMEVEALEAPVSAEAIGLLVRIRKECAQRESDGELDALSLQAVAVACRIPKARLNRVLAALADEQLVELLPSGGVLDVNYAVWCRTQEQRAGQREQWRSRQQRSRANSDVTPVSRRDLRVSHADVTEMSRPPSPDPSPQAYAHARAAAASPVTPLPVPPEVQGRAGELNEGCAGILARPLRAAERDLVLGWASTLRRSGELVAVTEVLETVAREMNRPTPEGTLPVNLAWSADAVATLGRAPLVATTAEDWRQLSEAARRYGDVAQ